MSTIKLLLLGKFRIEADANLIQRIEPRKAEELLIYLLLYRDQPQSREHLADVLWGEISPEQSKSYLRKALWQLQSILESFCGQNMLLVDGDWLQINPHFDFWLDIEVLEKAFKNTQGVRGTDLEEKQAESMEAAVEIYQGNFMEGWYQDWCLYERERLQHLYLAMLDKLMDHCESHDAYEKGLILGERILYYDRARERTHRRLMRLYYLAGDRTSALRQYRKCVTMLKEELDVEPAESTRVVYEMIRADELDRLTQSTQADKVGIAKTEKEHLRAVFRHMSTFHKELSQMQKQLAQDMQVIQRTIKGN
jgi:DNA-binding SARP family transcriptional activator